MVARRGAPAGRPLSPSSRAGTPFPRTFLPAVRKILSRLFRVFVHVYIHHFDRIAHMGSEAHVNTCYKHFYYFVKEFGLIDTKELEPLVSGRPGPSGLRPPGGRGWAGCSPLAPGTCPLGWFAALCCQAPWACGPTWHKCSWWGGPPRPQGVGGARATEAGTRLEGTAHAQRAPDPHLPALLWAWPENEG